MRERIFALALVAAMVLAGLAYSQEHKPRRPQPQATPSSAQRAQKPNIIILESDDQSVSQFQRAVMPHTFREVVDAGTTFSQMVATPPLCCPSRAATLTGDYPHNSGVGENGRIAYRKLVDKDDVLPVWLRNAGYRTALVGKFIQGYTKVAGRRPARGWDHWFMLAEPKSYWGPRILDGRRIRRYGPRQYLTRLLNRDAVRFVRTHAAKDAPFFLWYTPWAPHNSQGAGADGDPPACAAHDSPLPTPTAHARFRRASVPDLSRPSFNEPDISDKPAPFDDLERLSPGDIRALEANWRCGAASLATFDRGIGQILRTLRRAGELDNTMIVYTSDNGVSFGEHRIPHGKIRPADEAARVPMAIRPAATQLPARGAVSDEPVGTVDIAPTILAAAGADPCDSGDCRAIDGTSMWPLLSDPNAPSWDSDRGLLLELDHNKCSYTAIRTTKFTFVRYREPIRQVKPPLDCPIDGATEFYDRAADPFELDNLAAGGDMRSVVEEVVAGSSMRRRLQQLETCSGHPGTGAAKPCE